MIHYRIFSKFYRLAAQRMCRQCSPFVNKDSRILDVGCGSGIVGDSFKKYFQSEVYGIDIIDQRVSKIPFSLYDGKNVPFPDNSFDNVLINFVLHHCEDPVYVLSEARRVLSQKGKIIIYEDIPDGLFFRITCKLHGITFAKFFQKNDECGSFKRSGEWKEIFNKLGLELIFEKKAWPILNQRIFVLRKNK
jgi:ubiquinone/menaquinone biosynthesis C-methylase UbiE